ncbi:MAG: hypothetical protein JO256_12090 [Alphaproteobacteria bacterium]|nr:hypothetical protein [Alphaproteobacteria bacterium]
MQNYEIRVVRPGGPIVHMSHYVSDYAALRSARMLAEADDGLEIWRDAECIYKTGPHIAAHSAFR